MKTEHERCSTPRSMVPVQSRRQSIQIIRDSLDRLDKRGTATAATARGPYKTVARGLIVCTASAAFHIKFIHTIFIWLAHFSHSRCRLTHQTHLLHWFSLSFWGRATRTVWEGSQHSSLARLLQFGALTRRAPLTHSSSKWARRASCFASHHAIKCQLARRTAKRNEKKNIFVNDGSNCRWTNRVYNLDAIIVRVSIAHQYLENDTGNCGWYAILNGRLRHLPII